MNILGTISRYDFTGNYLGSLPDLATARCLHACTTFDFGEEVHIRVVRGDINFEILRDPLDFLFLIDPYGPYLIEFSFVKWVLPIDQGPFLGQFLPFQGHWEKRPWLIQMTQSKFFSIVSTLLHTRK